MVMDKQRNILRIANKNLGLDPICYIYLAMKTDDLVKAVNDYDLNIIKKVEASMPGDWEMRLVKGKLSNLHEYISEYYIDLYNKPIYQEGTDILIQELKDKMFIFPIGKEPMSWEKWAKLTIPDLKNADTKINQRRRDER